MPYRPCTPEAGAATDSASARVDRHEHSSAVGWINLTTLLLRFASFGRAAPHASVARRATSYGFHPQLVSIWEDEHSGRARRGARKPDLTVGSRRLAMERTESH